MYFGVPPAGEPSRQTTLVPAALRTIDVTGTAVAPGEAAPCATVNQSWSASSHQTVPVAGSLNGVGASRVRQIGSGASMSTATGWVTC